MKLVRKIIHWVVPGESNNQKSKAIHASGLLTLKLLLVSVQVGIYLFSTGSLPKVLGYAANIAPSEVIELTNRKRVEAGLSPLTENAVLSEAALAKGKDMLANDYWAHVSPDGTQPWYFFTSLGYSYRYAGENLARDFSNPTSVVEAWIASPSHRDNLLSSNYKEIGIGVVEGDLNGVDTTIVVQFFGTKYVDKVSSPIAGVDSEKTGLEEDVALAPVETLALVEETGAGVEETKFISPFGTTKGVSLLVVGGLLSVLSVDAVVVNRRRIKRIGGRTLAHMAFLGMILSLVLILKAGKIL